jgi:hypothetical protein
MGSEHPSGAPGAIEGDRVFVLRFWIERAAPDSVLWRAKVSDLSAGTEKHLNGVDAALEYVRQLLRG